jgi:hypothetical protein
MYADNWTFLISVKNIPFVEFYTLEVGTEQAKWSEERINNYVCFKWVYERFEQKFDMGTKSNTHLD